MSYILPSVQVYEQLSNSGGVQNSVPDLNACIVGPCYNVQAFNAATATTASTSYSGHIHSGIVLNGSNAPILDTGEAATFQSYLPQVAVGQVVETTSVKAWFVDPSIVTVSGTATKTAGALSAWDKLTIQAGGTVNFNSLNSAGDPLVKQGDTLVLIYSDSSTATTKVSSIVSDTVVRVVDSLPFAVEPTKFYIVRKFAAIQVPGASLDLSNVNQDGSVAITALATTTYGKVVDADIHIEYRALRRDLSNRILTIADVLDAQGTLGALTDKNPLGLAVDMCLANTITQVKAVAIDSDDLVGYQEALELLEGTDEVYFLVPLTQEDSIIEAFHSHVEQMSTPQEAGWRMTIVNTPIPESKTIGQENEDDPRTGAAITSSSGSFLLTDSGATFISNGVTPGDTVVILAGTPSTDVGNAIVTGVNSNQQIVISGVTVAATGVSYYVKRTLSKTAQAQHVAAVSRTFGSNRVCHVQPDTVGIIVDGETKYLPGYYLCAALAGMGAGFPVQQGFTNIGVAGITDIRNSNFYFPKAAMNLMAEAGTLLFAQEVQGGTPYCRHELMTDVSVLEYREMLKVKNWDFLAYYFKRLTTPFIGKWNITEDTLNTIYHTVLAGIDRLKAQKLPRIGPPLIDGKITKLTPNALNKDTIDLYISVAIVSPTNYINLYLVI